jgi:hypothetical protein
VLLGSFREDVGILAGGGIFPVTVVVRSVTIKAVTVVFCIGPVVIVKGIVIVNIIVVSQTVKNVVTVLTGSGSVVVSVVDTVDIPGGLLRVSVLLV